MTKMLYSLNFLKIFFKKWTLGLPIPSGLLQGKGPAAGLSSSSGPLPDGSGKEYKSRAAGLWIFRRRPPANGPGREGPGGLIKERKSRSENTMDRFYFLLLSAMPGIRPGPPVAQKNGSFPVNPDLHPGDGRRRSPLNQDLIANKQYLKDVKKT